MERYGMVAFYGTSPEKVASHAEALGRLYRLEVRYEPLPAVPSSVASLLGKETLFCLVERSACGYRKLLRYLYAVRKPFIIVPRGTSPEACRRVTLPVGYLAEERESVVWANFFRRRCPESSLELIVPRERDAGIAAMVANNVDFMENVLVKSGVAYRKSRVEKSFEKSLRELFRTNGGSMVLMMRRFRLFPFYIPYNLRLLRRYAHAPVMVIPRDDELYIPCH